MTVKPRHGLQWHSGKPQSAVLLLAALLLLPACTPNQGGGTPSSSATASPSTSGSSQASPASPSPSGSIAPDDESTVPAPAPAPATGPPSGPGQGNAELAITLKPSASEPEVHYTLVCVNGAPDPESKHPAADAACAALKNNAAVLAAPTIRADQACTEQYGGPQEATVTGVVDGVPVDDAFKRTNGCEISAWDAAKEILGSAGGAA